MRAYPLLGQVGRCLALEIESVLGPVKWHRANRRMPFGAQKLKVVLCNVQEPTREISGPVLLVWGSRCIKELNRPARDATPITKLIRNQEETVRYIICASGA